MSRRHNKNNKRQNTPPAAKPTSAPTSTSHSATESPAQALDELQKVALAKATEVDLEAMEAAPPLPPNTSTEDILRRAAGLVALLEAQRQRLECAEADLARRATGVAEQEHAVNQDRSELGARQAELSARDGIVSEREKKLGADEAALLRRHEEILQRELDADAGFSRRNREALAQLEAEGQALRIQFSRHREKMDAERMDFETALQDKRDRLTMDAEGQRAKDAEATAAARAAAESELTSQREELDRARDALHAEARRLRKLSRDLELDRELFQEDREAFDDKVARRAAREVELKNGELRAFAERLEAARAERDRLAQVLAEREEADRRFGGETPGEVLERLRVLERERRKLRAELDSRPSAEATVRLQELEGLRELLENDNLKLRAELADVKQRARRTRLDLTELKGLEAEKGSLEATNGLLHETNRQLRAEVDTLIKGVEGKSPFPSCSEMDMNNKLQSTRPTNDVIRSLPDFAEYVRHRMAWDPETKKELYYSAEDVRSFLGGLAMSRLHLLQGISGTGKTSLPLAFARAIGAGWAMIEVQAGWRDRQDLIGHFNTFARRFYESEFLKAIYRASTPQYRDTPFIVVLDEMNLSHPEQYFADLLSALEQDEHRRRLVLMTAAIDPAPRLLKDGGTKLPVPPNVWFIGTANHDETTKDFADKTYDRAHVMELPRNRETFKRKDFSPQNPFSLKALQMAFDTAVQEHSRDAATAYQFLHVELGEMLGDRFRVGWGNRLERQSGFYVPVVVAAGGTVGEATDHLLATKLLRKIRDRHDNRADDIEELRNHIQSRWGLLDKKHEPRRSLALLQQELHRLRHDGV